MMIKVSIITVNLNNAAGLHKTIKSVINQNFDNYELVIIDGNSTDNSVEIIQQYSDKISYWVSESDRGIYDAMNKGIRKSRGEYCYFLNSGDILYDDNVLKTVFKSNSGENILVGNIIMTLEQVARIEKYPGLSFGLFYTGSVCHQASFMKRALFDKYGFYDESLKIVSDWKFFLKTIVLGNESFRYFDTNIAYHDLLGISITENELFMNERKMLLEEMFPSIILQDYHGYWPEVIKMKRLNHNKYTKILVWFFERCLNKLEKSRAKNEIKRADPLYKARISELI